MKKALCVAVLLAAGCTDTCVARIGAYGEQGVVECYSGTKLIYEGASTGKIESAMQSDGYRFKEVSSGKLVEVSGNCVIRY